MKKIIFFTFLLCITGHLWAATISSIPTTTDSNASNASGIIGPITERGLVYGLEIRTSISSITFAWGDPFLNNDCTFQLFKEDEQVYSFSFYNWKSYGEYHDELTFRYLLPATYYTYRITFTDTYESSSELPNVITYSGIVTTKPGPVITYTAPTKLNETEDKLLNPYGGIGTQCFNAHIISHSYDSTTHTGTITFDDTLITISNAAFANCQTVTAFTLPPFVTTLGDDVFSGCTNLTSINLPSSITKMGTSVFASCTGLQSLVFPKHLMSISDATCSRCQGNNCGVKGYAGVILLGRSSPKNWDASSE